MINKNAEKYFNRVNAMTVISKMICEHQLALVNSLQGMAPHSRLNTTRREESQVTASTRSRLHFLEYLDKSTKFGFIDKELASDAQKLLSGLERYSVTQLPSVGISNNCILFEWDTTNYLLEAEVLPRGAREVFFLDRGNGVSMNADITEGSVEKVIDSEPFQMGIAKIFKPKNVWSR